MPAFYMCILQPSLAPAWLLPATWHAHDVCSLAHAQRGGLAFHSIVFSTAQLLGSATGNDAIRLCLVLDSASLVWPTGKLCTLSMP